MLTRSLICSPVLFLYFRNRSLKVCEGISLTANWTGDLGSAGPNSNFSPWKKKLDGPQPIRTTSRIWGLTPFFGRFRPKMGCLTPIALHRNAPINHSPNGLRRLHPQSNANAEDRCIKPSPTAFSRFTASHGRGSPGTFLLYPHSSGRKPLQKKQKPPQRGGCRM